MPCRPIHHADLQRGKEEEGEGRREGGGKEGWRGDGGEREGEGGGGAALLSSVYKPDRWSGALTRTIKQKTTGCFLLCFFSFSFKAEPGSSSTAAVEAAAAAAAPRFVITRSSVGEGRNKVTREG